MSFGVYNPEWERKKAQLIRNLFNDLPPLSPVLEEDESSGSSLCRFRPLTSGSPTPAYSPLPPLIIEKEVPRNNCDEPPEFYIKLEKKMRRIYKKLFIDGQSVSSVSDYTPDSDMYSYSSESEQITSQSNQTEEQSSLEDTDKVEISDDNDKFHREPRKTSSIADNENDIKIEVTNYSNEKLKSTGLKRKSSDSDGAINNSKKSNFENFRELTDISSSTSRDDESSPGYYRQVTFQADVHRDATDYGLAETTVGYEKDNENNDLREIDVLDEGSADLENTRAPDNSKPVHTSSETAEVEVMRTQRMHHSAGSLLYQQQEESPRELMVEVCRSEAQTEVLLHDASNTGFEHHLRRTSECHASSVERENSLGSTESSASGERYKDASTQTSDRDEVNRRILQNVFVGRPIVAKVIY